MSLAQRLGSKMKDTVSDSLTLPSKITVWLALYNKKLYREAILLNSGVCILVHMCLLWELRELAT